MNNNPILINILFIMFLSIHLACSGDNSKTSVEDCVDVQAADLQSSKCLANSLLNVCNTFVCNVGPTPIELKFMDCMLIDCDSFQCEDRIVDNITVEDDIFIAGTTKSSPLGNEIIIDCSPIVQ
jgi:hypothetical protein